MFSSDLCGPVASCDIDANDVPHCTCEIVVTPTEVELVKPPPVRPPVKPPRTASFQNVGGSPGVLSR